MWEGAGKQPASFPSLSPLWGHEKTEHWGKYKYLWKKHTKESKDRRGAGRVCLHSLGDQVPPKTFLFRHAAGAEACSFLPPSLHWHQEQPQVLGPGAPWGAGLTLPPNCAPPLASGLCHGAVAAPVYCVCELFTCFVCCHPASETRQTSKLNEENKVQRYPELPPLSGTLLPPLPLPSLSLSEGRKQKLS